MRVIDRCSLSANRGLWIVEVSGRTFLLGEAEGGISNLAELDAAQLAVSAVKPRPRGATGCDPLLPGAPRPRG